MTVLASPSSPLATSPQTMAQGREPFSWEDDEDMALFDQKPSSSSGTGSCFQEWNLPRWVHTGFHRLLVLLLCLSPGVLEYLYCTFLRQDAVYSPLHTSPLSLGGYTLLFWSLYAATSFLVYFACRLTVRIVPAILIKLTQCFFGQVSRRFDIYVGYVTDLHGYISATLFNGLFTIAYFVMFRPDLYTSANGGLADANRWRTIGFNLVCSFLVTSFLVLVEKFLVQIIAVRFHRTAYHDRIKTANYESDVLNRLNREAKRIYKKRAQILQEYEWNWMRSQKERQVHLTAASGAPASFWKKRAHSFVGKSKFNDDMGLAVKSTSTMDGTGLGLASSSTHHLHERSKSLDPEDTAKLVQMQASTSTDMVDSQTQLAAQHADHPSDFDSHQMGGAGGATESPVSAGTFSMWSLFFSPTSWQSPRRTKRAPSLADDQSSVEAVAKPGSDRFRKLAKELATGLDIASPKEAKKVARRIFEALSPSTTALLKARAQKQTIDETLYDRCKYEVTESLTMQQFATVFPSIVEAEKAFSLFDKDANGSITPQEMKDTVLAAFKDRKALSASLRDVGSAVGKLDVVMTVGALLVALLFSLLIFGLAVGPFLVTSMSMILAVTFIIGNSAKNMFEGIIFLFITHPFDCGDRVFIDGQNLIVKELGILTTVFLRWDGQVIYSPNSVLAAKQLTNVRRSPNQIEVVEIHVAFNTPMDKLLALKHRLHEWLHAESREYVPRMELQPIEIENVNKIKIQLFLEYRFNWQDGDRRFTRRSKFLFFLKQLVEELGIHYEYPVQSVHLEQQQPPQRIQQLA